MVDEASGYDFDEPEYERFVQSIGMFVIAFNELEVALGGTLMHLLGQDGQTGTIFVSHLSAGVKLTLLEALRFKIKDDVVAKLFDDHLRKAKQMNDERNRVIHSEYWFDMDGGHDLVTLHRKLRHAHFPATIPPSLQDVSKHIKTISAEEIFDLADETTILASNLMNLGDKLRPSR